MPTQVFQPAAPGLFIPTSFYNSGQLALGTAVADIVAAASNTKGIYIASGQIIAASAGGLFYYSTIPPIRITSGVALTRQMDGTNVINNVDDCLIKAGSNLVWAFAKFGEVITAANYRIILAYKIL